MQTHVETLQNVLGAARQAVEITTGCKVTHEALASVDLHAATFNFWAVLPQRTGPVESIVVGCERGVVDTIVQQTFPPDELQRTSREERDRIALASFRTLCSVFQHTLSKSSRWYDAIDASFLEFGPGTVSASFGGGRTFSVTTACPSGTMQVVMTYASQRVDPILDGDDVSLDEPGSRTDVPPFETLRATDVRQVLDQLVIAELDVQLVAPSEPIGPVAGAVVGSEERGSERLIAVSIPDDAGGEDGFHAGSGVTVFFLHAGRLLQFSTDVLEVAESEVGGSATLRVLLIRRPTEITQGQRRRAFRVVPSAPVAASLESLDLRAIATSPGERGPGACTMSDVSFLGACIEGPMSEEIFRHTEGSLALCRFELPKPWGPVEVPAVVRRFARRVAPDGSFRDLLGVEFFAKPTHDSHAHALDAVRQYVLSEFRARSMSR